MRRLVIFDCDGTLVDSQQAIVTAMSGAFRASGLASPSREQTLAIVGLSLPQAIARLAPRATVDQQLRLVEGYRDNARALREQRAEDPLYPGAAEVVAALAARDDVVLGIATGKSRRGVDRLLDHYRWRGKFATLQTADDNPSKPHPGMLERAMAETGFEPGETLMIGDTAFDMAMAAAAGTGAIGVAWGYHPVEELADAGAHAIVARFDELIEACDRLQAQRRSGAT
jgi:phosphoglycolate phosphatase